MAMIAVPTTGTAAPEAAQLTDCRTLATRARNDAFSFWKLPEDWRDELEPMILLSELIAERFLFESYRSGDDPARSRLMQAYYQVKPVIPSFVRHRLNAAAIRARVKPGFPHWPCESVLLEFWREWLRLSLALLGRDDGNHIGFWPDGHDCCVVLTHDVESPAGFARIERIADLEERYGFRSAWNLPLMQYPIDWNLVMRLRQRGFEFGAHGLSHDGRLFRSARDFAALAPTVERMAAEHGLHGFRAPSTLRNASWIATMAFDFDSSFADTDPYEPQPGGTCSLFPFMLSRVVELPYTLPQDHTLLHLLRRSPLPVWAMKAKWIASVGGMILTLTHPDYTADRQSLAAYEDLLRTLTKLPSAWRALPSEVAAWWRERSDLRLSIENDGQPVISPPGSQRARVRRLSEHPLAG